MINSNQRKACIVVGNIYESFCNGVNVLGETDIIEKLQYGTISYDSIILGQGLSKISIMKILELSETHGIKCVTNLLNIASTNLTHKATIANVLITNPIKCGHSQYKYELAIDDNLDRLSDHVTGEHIGATLLIEAARQSGISVLEMVFPKEAGFSYGYNLHGFNTKYYRYAYPIPTDIYTKIESEKSRNKHQREIVLIARFYQNDNCIAEMTMEVDLIDKKLLGRIENKESRKLCSEILDNKDTISSNNSQLK